MLLILSPPSAPPSPGPASGLVAGEDAIQQALTPKHFADLARKACSTGLDQLAAAFPRVQVRGAALGAGLGRSCA